MRTYTHGAVGYLLYSSGSAYQQRLAVVGAMAPDLFLALGYPFHFAGDSEWAEALHRLLHHSYLHWGTEVMHSFLFILPLLGMAGVFLRASIPFLVGMLSHAVLDLLTHQSSAYNHFLPLPIDPFRAPVSYTSLWFTILEHGLLCIFVIWFLKMRSARRSSPRRV